VKTGLSFRFIFDVRGVMLLAEFHLVGCLFHTDVDFLEPGQATSVRHQAYLREWPRDCELCWS
jgi:hypothetical protein